MTRIDYGESIPNNVDLAGDRALVRALERWQPAFLRWWRETGPEGAHACDVYLRTAVSAEPSGWAHFAHVRMPEYRWGIFLKPPAPERRIAFGAHRGEPAWQEVPGEHRSNLRRIIVTQGDTEPASVEQQRRLGLCCPSLYDLRNLFQVNVEEGRHLWAMVYLLHRYFGRDGREEADALLERRSGDPDRPRILAAFNEPTPDWLSFFLFTYFTDRDGKFQLCALAESGFDPLARTARFMLTEEAHHMFVGQSGVARIVRRTAEVMTRHRTDDPARARELGVIDLPTLQRYLNLHYSLTLDLFGSERSSNAATYYTSGLKGRFEEERIEDDHRLEASTYPVLEASDGALATRSAAALGSLNERLRDEFIEDTQGGLRRWNEILERHGIEFRLSLPHRAFHRRVGSLAGLAVTPEGRVVSAGEWERGARDWLPGPQDRAFVESLMGRVVEPGRFAHWIAPPPRGIDRQPLDFEYVRFG
jgi:benzoyl-CoA 2,3-dioxygenase component B